MFHARTVAGVLALSVLAGCGGLDERERSLFDEAYAASEARDWSRADAILSDLLSTRPDHARSLLYRGQARFHLERSTAALADVDIALGSRMLTAEERHLGLIIRGRSLIEIGRDAVSDSMFRMRRGTAEQQTEAREKFLAAGAALHDALQMDRQSYEATLWRAFALYRQENFAKAIDILQACAQRQPDDWRHVFFTALAEEGLHGKNSRSILSAIALARGSVEAERLPVFVYLVDVADEIPEEHVAEAHRLLARFQAESGTKNETVRLYLAALEVKREQERLRIITEQTIEDSKSLARRGQFAEAVAVLDTHIEREGSSNEVTALRSEITTRWSRLLDLETQTARDKGDRARLSALIQEYAKIRDRATDVELKISIGHKIGELEGAVAQMTSTREMREAMALLSSGDARKARSRLDSVDPKTLGRDDRSHYYYLLGSARFQLGEMHDAVAAFSEVREGRSGFADIDLLHGLALERTGQKEAAVGRLLSVPMANGNDESRRVLARHFTTTGSPERAIEQLGALAAPVPDDDESLVEARVAAGTEALRSGDHEDAAEHLEAVRPLVDTRLGRRKVRVYMLLGQAYDRLGRPARALEIYQQLLNGQLSDAERTESRTVHLEVARLHRAEGRDDLAYQDLREFLRLGGTIPEDQLGDYGVLAARFADFFPLDRVSSWNYTGVRQDLNYMIRVVGRSGDGYSIERHESGSVTEETWTRDGLYLVQNTGRDGAIEFRVPVQLAQIDAPLPFLPYETGPGNRLKFTSEIVATNQAVQLSNGTTYVGCLQVRVTRKLTLPSGREQRTRYVIFLAPDVGEVKRQVLQDEILITETELAGLVPAEAE